jgi:hypothetical protein
MTFARCAIRHVCVCVSHSSHPFVTHPFVMYVCVCLIRRIRPITNGRATMTCARCAGCARRPWGRALAAAANGCYQYMHAYLCQWFAIAALVLLPRGCVYARVVCLLLVLFVLLRVCSGGLLASCIVCIVACMLGWFACFWYCLYCCVYARVVCLLLVLFVLLRVCSSGLLASSALLLVSSTPCILLLPSSILHNFALHLSPPVCWSGAQRQSLSAYAPPHTHANTHTYAIQAWVLTRTIQDLVLHIELRRWADICVVAPCSANTLAKVSLSRHLPLAP